MRTKLYKKMVISLLVSLGIFFCFSCSDKKSGERHVKETNPLDQYQTLSDAEIQQTDATGKTLLHKAAEENDTDLAAYLLERGLSRDRQSGKGQLILIEVLE